MSDAVREALISLAAAAVVAPAMELWARFLHGRVWHGILFSVHRSHHEERIARFERNDVLSVLHAPVAAGLVVIGCIMHGTLGAILRGAGAGMTLFGLAYVVVHDGFVHGRLPVRALARFRFFRRVRGAHRIHHRRGGPPYGLFAGPRELARAPHHASAPATRRAAQRALPTAPSDPSTSR